MTREELVARYRELVLRELPRRARAERIRDSLRAGDPLPALPAELSAWRVGDVGLVFTPGEIFTEIGMTVKQQSPLPRTCFAGYTDGTIWYVPVPEAYPEGGYEVTHACRVAPAAAGMITDTSLELLRRVAAARGRADKHCLVRQAARHEARPALREPRQPVAGGAERGHGQFHRIRVHRRAAGGGKRGVPRQGTGRARR